ncbi:MAG: DUF2079 domain-containing protein [Candidatus Aminicenantes bacterium]|nr:DUF2079 domain-containing protein [Candidatus Aminicenantes bacterium]
MLARPRRFYLQNRHFSHLLAAWLLLFFLLRTLQHFSFATNAWDLSIFDYAMSSTLRGEFMAEPFHAFGWGSHLAIHFTPILFLFVPLYLVFQGPLFLLHLQVLAVGGASIPLYLIAKRTLQDRRMALAVAGSFLLYRPLLNGLMYDFHPEMLFPLLVFGSYYFIKAKRSVPWFAVFIVLALAVKEDFAIYVLFYCLWLGRKRESRKAGWGAALLSALYILLVMAVWIPHFRAQVHAPPTYEFTANWHDYGDSPTQIVREALAHPGRLLRDLAPLDRVQHLANYLLPLLFIPLLSPTVLLILPPVAVGWFSRIPAMTTFGLHYGAALIPFVFMALMAGLARLQALGRRNPPRFAKCWRWLFLLILTVNAANFKWNLFSPEQYRIIQDYPRLRNCLRSLPAQASVASQSALIPHVPKRRGISMLPEIGDAEYVLLHLGLNPWPLEPERLRELAEGLQRSPQYRRLCGSSSLFLYRKVRD